MVTEGVIVQTQIQGLEVDQIKELPQREIGLDALDAGNMTTLLMNIQT